MVKRGFSINDLPSELIRVVVLLLFNIIWIFFVNAITGMQDPNSTWY